MKSGILDSTITPGKENYLKVLLDLSRDGEARSIEVAEAMGITKASVSSMMRMHAGSSI